MAYYTKVLQPDEQVKVIGRLHWSIYIRPVIVLLIAAGVLIAAYLVTTDPMWQLYAQYASATIAVLGLLVLLAAWIKRRTTEIVVTDRRVIHKVGILVRHTQEMNVSKVESVDVDQGIGGRIWGYGSVRIRGTGSTWEPLRGVGSPVLIRNAIVVG